MVAINGAETVRTGSVGVSDWVEATKELTICGFSPGDVSAGASGPNSEFDKFQTLAKRLLAVPKSEVESV